MISADFKYLGIWFHHLKGLSTNIQRASSRGKFAIVALMRKLSRLDVGHDIAVTMELYPHMVEAAMMYDSCEVWGMLYMTARDPTVGNIDDVERVHRNFVRFRP